MNICPTCHRKFPTEMKLCPWDAAPLHGGLLPTEHKLSAVLSPHYRILNRLGEGGMGTVFLAEQLTLGCRLVALKVLRRNLLSDPDFSRRFEDEASSTGRIRHQNVVTVYEFGHGTDGSPYIAMEYLEGESLRAVLEAEQSLQLAAVSNILQQAARGLTAAHKLGIVHRDLKPDNIFLTRDDNGSLLVKILDFGVAKMRESISQTATGLALGTPAYMSVEQAAGMRGEDLDQRSDIYSLAVITYEMIAGERPFSADTPLAYVKKHLLEPPPPLRSTRPDLQISVSVERVVSKALSKNREDRHFSALDFAADFANAVYIGENTADRLPQSLNEGRGPEIAADKEPGQYSEESIGRANEDDALKPSPSLHVSTKVVISTFAVAASICIALWLANSLTTNAPSRHPATTVVRSMPVFSPQPSIISPTTTDVRSTIEQPKEESSLGRPDTTRTAQANRGTGKRMDHRQLVRVIELVQSGQFPQALAICRPAAKDGDPDGLFCLGIIYEHGWGVSQSYAEAEDWYQKAVDVGSPEGMNNLGVLYQMGRGVVQDISRAKQLFEKSAARGVVGAMNNLGDLCEAYEHGHRHYAEALEWYEKAAAAGSSDAMYNLGQIYQNGWGPEQNYSQTLFWYRKSADLGNSAALNDLGYLYQHGLGVTQDYAKSKSLYEQAAALGNASAMNNIGLLYDSGLGVTADAATARSWYANAANHGSAEATVNLEILARAGR